MLRCPADHHSLKVQTVGSATFAHCVHCAGIWLTREALLPPSLDPASLPPATRIASPTKRKRRSALACPECNGRLTPERVEGIEIDRCSRCVGVWLDAGEYDAVRRHIEYPHSAASPNRESAGFTDTITDEGVGFGIELVGFLTHLFF
jgi:Zn-finger nucleic acid-binding protein